MGTATVYKTYRPACYSRLLPSHRLPLYLYTRLYSLNTDCPFTYTPGCTPLTQTAPLLIHVGLTAYENTPINIPRLQRVQSKNLHYVEQSCITESTSRIMNCSESWISLQAQLNSYYYHGSHNTGTTPLGIYILI